MMKVMVVPISVIQAIRSIERWGTGEMMKAAFAGFKPLPEPPKPELKQWWQILDLYPRATEQEIREAYRRLAMVHHPDKGGSAAMFNIIHTAYQEGLAKLK